MISRRHILKTGLASTVAALLPNRATANIVKSTDPKVQTLNIRLFEDCIRYYLNALPHRRVVMADELPCGWMPRYENTLTMPAYVWNRGVEEIDSTEIYVPCYHSDVFYKNLQFNQKTIKSIAKKLGELEAKRMLDVIFACNKISVNSLNRSFAAIEQHDCRVSSILGNEKTLDKITKLEGFTEHRKENFCKIGSLWNADVYCMDYAKDSRLDSKIIILSEPDVCAVMPLRQDLKMLSTGNGHVIFTETGFAVINTLGAAICNS